MLHKRSRLDEDVRNEPERCTKDEEVAERSLQVKRKDVDDKRVEDQNPKRAKHEYDRRKYREVNSTERKWSLRH